MNRIEKTQPSTNYTFRELSRDEYDQSSTKRCEYVSEPPAAISEGLERIGLFNDRGMLLGWGSIRAEALPHSAYDRAWKICALTTYDEQGSAGAASILLTHLLGLARSHAASLIWCDVGKASLRLLRSFGFTLTEADCKDENVVRVTSRVDGVVDISRPSQDEEIVRIGNLPRLSRAVVFNRMVHIGGLLPNRSDISAGDQAREILEKIDAILLAAGTSRHRLISAMVFLKDLRHTKEVNAVWEAWVPAGTAPARACVQAVPGSEEYAVEIAAIAAT
ncbi:RidA family protein [Tardiphaga sp. 866_E4_N2_1]|uniref:RidA family protein n=1 Tax=unclassified Tardiphaga TaxID=2631404 RepID=UPI003F2885BC